MRPEQAGAAEIARLFMKGQRLRFVVWYMGQKVFDDYVTITGPLVEIKADVYPINVTTYTKSMRLPVDTFVGFTLTDVYVGLALNKTNDMFANRTLIPQIIAPFNTTYTNYTLANLLINELAKGVAELYNTNVRAEALSKTLESQWNQTWVINGAVELRDNNQTVVIYAPAEVKNQTDSSVVIMSVTKIPGAIRSGVVLKFNGTDSVTYVSYDNVTELKIRVRGNWTASVYMFAEWAYGAYKPAQFGGDFVYLPNLVVLRNATTPKYQFTTLNNYVRSTLTYRSYKDTTHSGSLQVPAGQSLWITLIGAKIEPDPANNATYIKLTSYNGTENSNKVEPQLILSGDLVVINNAFVKNYLATINANHTIVLTVNAKCGSVNIAPGADDLTIDLTVNAGDCAATVSYVATNRTYSETSIDVSSAPSSEYAVSFDRWFLVPYDLSLVQYNVLYHATNVVERNDVLYVLSHTGETAKCATTQEVVEAGEDDKYIYVLELTGVEVVNYRTLKVELPWKTAGGGKAYVNITAYFANGTFIDYKVYNLTEMLADVRGAKVVVTLPLNFGKVAEKGL
jgi:hypothetical protein